MNEITPLYKAGGGGGGGGGGYFSLFMNVYDFFKS